MAEIIARNLEQWLSIGSKAVTVLFLPSLWVFHLYLDQHLDARFDEQKKELQDMFILQRDASEFARSNELVVFKSKTNSELQNHEKIIEINEAKAEARIANVDYKLESISEDIREIKELLKEGN